MRYNNIYIGRRVSAWRVLLFLILNSSFLILFASCGDDDPVVGFVSQGNGYLKVVSADLVFGPKADSSMVEVSCPEEITASTNKDWCTVSVDSNRVKVVVERNTQLDGRNAIVTLRSSRDSVRLSLIQSGAVWMVRGATSYSASDEDTTIVIPATLDFDYTVTKPDWMDGEEVEDGYQLHLHTNDTGGAREGNVTIKSSQGSKTIKFRQFGKRSVAGQYDITYTHTISDGLKTVTKTEKQRIEIEAENTKSYIYLKGLNPTYPIPVAMGSDGSLRISNGQTLDGVSQGYVFIVLHQDAEYQNFIFAGDCSYDASLTLTKKGDILMPSFNFTKKTVTFIDPIGEEATAIADGFSLKTATMPDIRFTQAGEDLGTYVNVKLTKVLE